jgi:hypothetical protein
VEARLMQQKMQEQAMLQDVMREQEKALKSHLYQMNRRQMEDYNDKQRMQRV